MLDDDGEYFQEGQEWLGKFKLFLVDEASLDDQLMDLDDGLVLSATAPDPDPAPIVEKAANPHLAVPPVKQRRLGLARRALASRPVNRRD